MKHSRRAVSPKHSEILSNVMIGRFEMQHFVDLISLRHQDRRVWACQPPEQHQTGLGTWPYIVLGMVCVNTQKTATSTYRE
jgi:hypothetical protein